MASFKRSKIWISIAIPLLIVSILFTAIFQGARWNAIPLAISIIMLILFFPILIIDIRKSAGDKKTKKEEAKSMDLKRAEIELEKERLEVEKLKLQQGIIEEATNHCRYCGCYQCGSDKNRFCFQERKDCEV